ncbi:RNAPII degradation factor, partial [Coemansia sp. RSA 2702]
HASQWGEVKSRKKQPGVKQQKPKHHREEPKPADKSSNVPRPASFRGGVRGGAARGRGGYSHAAGGRGKPTPTSKPVAADDAASWDIQPATDSKATDNWDAPSNASAAKAGTSSAAAAAAPSSSANGTAAPAKPAPMSWASIAKRGVKQPPAEPAQATKPVEDVAAEPKPTAEKQLAAEPAGASETVVETTVEETVTKDGSVKVEETVVTEVVKESAKPEPSADQPEPETAAQPARVEETPATAPSPKKPATNTRRLHQDAPVVMPSGKSTLERIGVQFGSLSIGGVELGSLKGAIEQPANETAPVETQKPAPAAPVAPAAAVPVAAKPEPVSAPAVEPTAASATAASQGPLTTYLQQQQQQQQQASTQTPSTNASSIGQMPLPNDYGAAIYGAADVQRNMMGFYDNYGYGQFIANKDNAAAASSAADAQPATSVPQAAGVNGSNNLGQAGLFPQMPQPFGMNHGMPYYNPYYYNMMQPGGQYHNPAFGNNPALAAAYGQPFMKQGMYPMYPGGTPQGLQGVGSQQPQQPSQQPSQQAGQQPNAAQQQQQASQQAQAGAQQVNQQAGVKGSAVGAQNAGAYGNINTQKPGNPYGHYSANIGSGFGMYEQDPALSNPPQQFGLGGILSASKAGGKDAGARGGHPAGTAPVMGGTAYYNAPQQQPQQPQQQQQLGGYPSQSNSSHPQG